MILLLYDVSVNSSRENYVVSVRSLVFLHVVLAFRLTYSLLFGFFSPSCRYNWSSILIALLVFVRSCD